MIQCIGLGAAFVISVCLSGGRALAGKRESSQVVAPGSPKIHPVMDEGDGGAFGGGEAVRGGAAIPTAGGISEKQLEQLRAILEALEREAGGGQGARKKGGKEVKVVPVD